jgi:Zn-finger nucleic acid-binding protein
MKLTYAPSDPRRYGHHCASCGGLFVAAKEWTELLEVATVVEAAIIDTTGATPLSSSQIFPLAACPACRTTMERATFAARSSISVDVCIVHGIWFDAGELFQTLRWLSDGRPVQPPTNAYLDVRLAGPPGSTLESGNDVYTRLAEAGSLLTLRRLFPWR